jgi:hypothetical protein
LVTDPEKSKRNDYRKWKQIMEQLKDVEQREKFNESRKELNVEMKNLQKTHN